MQGVRVKSRGERERVSVEGSQGMYSVYLYQVAYGAAVLGPQSKSQVVSIFLSVAGARMHRSMCALRLRFVLTLGPVLNVLWPCK